MTDRQTREATIRVAKAERSQTNNRQQTITLTQRQVAADSGQVILTLTHTRDSVTNQ